LAGWSAARPSERPLTGLRPPAFPHRPIRSLPTLFATPPPRAREITMDAPADGLGTLPQPGVVPKLSLTPGRVTHAGGALGSHTDDVLSSLLGMTAAEIAQLRADRVV